MESRLKRGARWSLFLLGLAAVAYAVDLVFCNARVREEDGTPVADVTVTFTYTYQENGTRTLTRQTNQNGRASVGFIRRSLTGTIDAEATKDGRTGRDTKTFSVGGGDARVDLNITLPSPRELSPEDHLDGAVEPPPVSP